MGTLRCHSRAEKAGSSERTFGNAIYLLSFFPFKGEVVMFPKFPLMLLVASFAFVQIYTPPWANKELPLHIRGKQYQIRLSLFSLHVNAIDGE